MKLKLFGRPKLVSKGPFLLSTTVETPEKILVLTLIKSEYQALMEEAIQFHHAELRRTLTRQKGAVFKPNPFDFEYDPTTLSFAIKPVDATLDDIKDYILYFVLPAASANSNSPRNT